MNVNVNVQREWNPLVIASMVVALFLLVPHSFAEVGQSFDELDKNLHHIEGAIVPKIFGLVRGLFGVGIGMLLTFVLGVGAKDNVSAASSGAAITIVLGLAFYFLPYLLAFYNSDWSKISSLL